MTTITSTTRSESASLRTQVLRDRRLRVFSALLLAGALLPGESAWAKALTEITYATQSGNKVVIDLKLDYPAEAPQAFTINDPARIAIDLPDTAAELASRQIDIGIGTVEGVTAVEAGGRTRVVVKLAQLVPYDVQTAGNTIRLVLEQPGAKMPAAASSARFGVADVDFRRTNDGAGRIVVQLSDPNMPVNVRQEGGKIIADFVNATVPGELERRLDVTDFATPVQTIDLRRSGSNARMVITPTGHYEQMAYQTGNTFTIEVKPVTPEQLELRQAQEERYTGERLSLNFQDIEVRAVLQLIADFTGLNVVVSDSVRGNITLRLQDVPWDQALDIILKTKGLDKRQRGNVLLVAPAEEIAAREKTLLESQKQVRELAPLRSELIQVNYAKAADLADLIKSKDASLLSERGRIKVDTRTNTLIVNDTDQNLSAIRALVAQLDVPVKQVLIESRVVIATDDFARALGVQFGYSRNQNVTIGGSDMDLVIGGTQPNGYTPPNGTITGIGVGGNEGLIVDLPAAQSGASLGLAIGRLGSYLLQLELQAMETEGQGTIVSSPKVITANQKPATIEQGVEIPYEESTSSGATSVSFKKAVLGLTVTPQITPDDRVLLDLKVSKDSRGQDTNAGPAINTQSVTTQVLVNNGETVVLGGVYERTNSHTVRRVPLLGELPVIGTLFRSKTAVDNRSELLIFVTPKILKESLQAE